MVILQFRLSRLFQIISWQTKWPETCGAIIPPYWAKEPQTAEG